MSLADRQKQMAFRLNLVGGIGILLILGGLAALAFWL